MVGLVQPKPFQKRKIELDPRETSFKSKGLKSTGVLIKFILIGISIVVFIYSIFYIFKSTIFSIKYSISKVTYDQASVKQLDDPYLYKFISSQIKKENYYVLRYLRRTSLLSQLQFKYPIINNIEIEYAGLREVYIKISFNKPDIIVSHDNSFFGIYDNWVFPLYSGDNLRSGVLDIELPEYLHNIKYLTGLFYEISSSDLISQIKTLDVQFPEHKKIIYIPGAQRTIVETDNKKLYFGNFIPLTGQIQNYEFLQKYYKNFKSIKEIDLGSLGLDKVIIKK